MSGHLSVDVNIHGWVIEGLPVLQVTQETNLVHLGPHLFGEAPVCGKVRAANGDFDRGWRTEIHDLAHDVASFKGKFAVGKNLGKPLSQPRLKVGQSDRAGLERREKHSLVRPAGPKENRVDGISGRLDANVSQRDRDIVGPRLAFDFLQDFVRHLLRDFYSGTCRRPETQPELVAPNARENLAAQHRTEQEDDQARQSYVDPNHGPAEP